MSGFCGINTFGNLTANGRKLRFEDFDKDNNGEISKSEYDAVLKEMQLDRVDLSVVDKNNDKTISKDEFALWGQKIQMQDAVNALAATISKDFAGKTQCLTELTNSLKDLIEEYASEYKGNVSKMAEKFEASLPAKYEVLKNLILANDSSELKSKILDDIYTKLIKPRTGEKDAVPEATAKRIIRELDAEADRFMKNYKGKYLDIDLEAHLRTYLNTSDSEKLKDASAKFKTYANKNSFAELTELAKEFLTAALDAGVTINLGGTIIKTTNAIKSALAKFTEADTLKALIEAVIANLSTKTFKENIVEEEELKAIAAEEKKFTDIKGSEYAVNTGLIDYNKIQGYSNNETISKKGKKSTEELKNNVKQEMNDIINNGLKEQMKQQIQTMLQAKGVPFEKIEQVFENVFNKSFVETVNSDEIFSTKHKTWFRNGNAEINIKQCVDQFIATFNANIANAIDKMNASNKDFDTADLDLTKLNLNGGKSKIETVNNDDIVKSYQTGTPLVTTKQGADYYVNIADQIIDGLKEQVKAKAQAMCVANGVKFDEKVFNSLFKDVKDLAVDTCVGGRDKKGRNWGGTGAAAASGAIAGVGALAAATTTVTINTLTGVTATGAFASIFPELCATSVVTGPVGWIVGGALLLGGILASIFAFGGNKSQSVLDTRSLVDGFTETFAQNYSKWVEEEKANKK